MSRERTSRPKASVPRGWALAGGLSMAPKSVATGSYGDSSGAKIAVRSITTITAPPTAPRGRRRQNSRTAPIQPRSPATGSAISPTAGTFSAITLPVPDARVDPRVDHVHAEVHDDEEAGHDHHQRLHQGVVAVLHRLDEEEPQAVEIEHLLRHHQPAEQEGELQPHH